MLRTPLYEEHQKLGASFTDFGGWEMPVRYGSDLDEHHAVRNSAGLFDISHMAEFEVSGDAASFLDYALVSKISELAEGRAKYSLICAQDGGAIDDLIVYRRSSDFLIISNAANRGAVGDALTSYSSNFDVFINDRSAELSLIAIQGPNAPGILQSQASIDLAPLRYYSIAEGELAGIPVSFCRTGYTGEDGFELLVDNGSAAELWAKLLEFGGDDLKPCGLASRDTLRLEAGMPLYGHELNSTLTPMNAGLGKVVRFDKESFVGKDELAQRQDDPPQLHGLIGEGRRAARADYEIFEPGGQNPIGKVTSGVLSPTLGYPIAMALLAGNYAEGTELEADVRGQRVGYKVTRLPFYKRGK